VVSMILTRDAPLLAAEVQKPARSECEAYCAGSSPTADACALTIVATACADRLSPSALPPFRTIAGDLEATWRSIPYSPADSFAAHGF
jgi:hypothetical protein